MVAGMWQACLLNSECGVPAFSHPLAFQMLWSFEAWPKMAELDLSLFLQTAVFAQAMMSAMEGLSPACLRWPLLGIVG